MKKMSLNMSSDKWWSFCLSLNVLIIIGMLVAVILAAFSAFSHLQAVHMDEPVWILFEWKHLNLGKFPLHDDVITWKQFAHYWHEWAPLVPLLALAAPINTLRPRQNGRHFPDAIFKCIFLNENIWISIRFSLKFVPEGPINNIPALVQIMAWRRPGDKPLSEPTLVSLLTHICITRPQWVNDGILNVWRYIVGM